MNNNIRLPLPVLFSNDNKSTLCKQTEYLSRLAGSSLQLISNTFQASRRSPDSILVSRAHVTVSCTIRHRLVARSSRASPTHGADHPDVFL